MFTSARPTTAAHSTAVRMHPRFIKFALSLALALAFLLALYVPAGFAANPDDPFYTTDELCKVTLVPTAATNTVGGSQTLTAKIESTGVVPPVYTDAPTPACWMQRVPAVLGGEEIPPPPFNIDFVALTGPNAGLTANVPVDLNWSASHTYSSQLVGTDVWQATTNLPQICVPDWELVQGWQGDVPPECEWVLDFPIFDPCNESLSECAGAAGPKVANVNCVVIATPCTTPVVSNTAAIEWVAPVTAQVAPSVSIASSKRCHTPNKFRIRPSAANGQVASMTLYVDGKKVRTVNGSTESFTINAAKYGPGSHSIKLVTTFNNGNSVTTTKTFNRCKVRAVAKRVEPRFTG